MGPFVTHPCINMGIHLWLTSIPMKLYIPFLNIIPLIHDIIDGNRWPHWNKSYNRHRKLVPYYYVVVCLGPVISTQIQPSPWLISGSHSNQIKYFVNIYVFSNVQKLYSSSNVKKIFKMVLVWIPKLPTHYMMPPPLYYPISSFKTRVKSSIK